MISFESFPPVEDLDNFEVPKVLKIKAAMVNTQFPKQTLNLNRQSKRQMKRQIKYNERILCQKKGRKDQKTCEYLRKVFERYDGDFTEQQLRSLTYITGFKRKQLIKWFYDRKKKIQDAVKAKMLSCPNTLFLITNMKTGKNITPSFNSIVCNKPIFQIEKVVRR
jgi:hypothetical protein